MLHASDGSKKRSTMFYGVDHISCACVAFDSNHGSTFADSSKRFAEISSSTDKRHLEGMLIDMVGFVRRGEYLGLVDAIAFEGFEYLTFSKMTNPRFSHDRDTDRGLDGLNQGRV